MAIKLPSTKSPFSMGSILDGIKAKRMAKGGIVDDENEDFLSEDMSPELALQQEDFEDEPIQDPEHEIEGMGEKRKSMISKALSKGYSK